MRKQFTFYASFREALKRIKDPAVRAEAYDAICDYAIDGIEPDLDSMPDAAAIAFVMARPNLDAAKAKSEAGKLGGGKSKPEADESKPEASSKQNAAEAKQTESKTKIENKIENKRETKIENECYTPPTPSPDDYGFSPPLLGAVEDWLSYKAERRESYKPTGLKSMLTQVQKAAAEYGDAAVIGVIRDSMASGYRGITFDRLRRSPPREPPSSNVFAELLRKGEFE